MMADAEITDEDRQAAETAIDEAIRRQDEGEHMGVENAYAQAIANARQAGTQLSTVLAHEAGVQDGLEQAASELDTIAANLDAHADEVRNTSPATAARDGNNAKVSILAARAIRALKETK